jgi:hypothetical protein
VYIHDQDLAGNDLGGPHHAKEVADPQACLETCAMITQSVGGLSAPGACNAFSVVGKRCYLKNVPGSFSATPWAGSVTYVMCPDAGALDESGALLRPNFVFFSSQNCL